LSAEGKCPTCGQAIEGPVTSVEPATGATTEAPAAPWHFKLLLVALVVYLAFRAVQGVVWVAHHV
jgi:hypothetical protein